MCEHFFITSTLDLHLDDACEAAANGNQYTTMKKLALFLFDSTVSSVLPDLRRYSPSYEIDAFSVYEDLRKGFMGSGFKRCTGLFVLHRKLINFLNETRENEEPFKVLYVYGKRFDGCPHHCKASCHPGQPWLPRLGSNHELLISV